VNDPPADPGESLLILGPANVGKTRLTARALAAWIEREGPRGVVVLDFAPELRREGRLLGGRLDRFTDIPGDAWRGVIEARAPRAEGEDDGAALELARDNAARGRRVLEAAPPDPSAVFVNDATIPFQAGDDPGTLTEYCGESETAVLNAFSGEELGVADPVSRNERSALEKLRTWDDREASATGPASGNP
jgi:hypothetical protein